MGRNSRKLTPNGEGVDFIVKVGGPTSIKQALSAIKLEGVISIIGYVGGLSKDDDPSFVDCMLHACTARGVVVGSRLQYNLKI